MRTIAAPVGALILLCALVVAGLLVGPAPLSVADIGAAFMHRLSGQPGDPVADAVLFQLRLPRVMAAVLVGVALAAAGAAFQQLFRNPLVSPDILGVSSGAALGAVLGMLLGFGALAIQSAAFVGGIVAVLCVYATSSAVRGRDPILVLVLAGVVVGALFGAGVALIKYLADPYNQLPEMTFWLLGGLSGVAAAEVWGALPLVVLGLVPLWLLRWRINVLSVGDEEARTLGVDVGPIRVMVIAAATLMTAATMAIAGVIGWVGLLVPHFARMAVGPDFGRLLPTSLLFGGCFMLGVDILARTLTAAEIPLGVLTAFVGAPLFLWQLITTRRSWQ